MTRRDGNDTAKARRLAEALRANLKRRKAQARARRGGAGVDGQESAENPENRHDQDTPPGQRPDEA